MVAVHSNIDDYVTLVRMEVERLSSLDRSFKLNYSLIHLSKQQTNTVEQMGW